MYNESDYDFIYEILILYDNQDNNVDSNKFLSYCVNDFCIYLINLFNKNQFNNINYDGNNIFKTKRIQ